MKATLPALSLIAALAAPAQARDEQQAIVIAGVMIIVPTYCPGWGVDVSRYRQLLAATGVSENELRTSPLREMVQAFVDYFPNENGDNRRFCAITAQGFGPTGRGMIYPR